MSVYVDKASKVIIQGFTGQHATFHAEEAMGFGTQIVGGVTPGKGGSTHLGLPVFNSVAEAVDATGASVSGIFTPPAVATDSLLDDAIDASFHAGPFPPDEMAFIDGPPTFAVEVRSENDYGRSAETAMTDKRADYFEAGTLAVWDVDPLARTITLYTQTTEIVFRPGDCAHAEPALPGWTLDVSALFE